jgi:hypothetical protein
MKFVMFENQDKFEPYLNALVGGGHERVEELGQADYLVIDYERNALRGVIDEARRRKMPIIILPHSVDSDLIWDGLRSPTAAACNFVIGNGHAAVMRMYGYGYPIGVTGWALSEMQEQAQVRREAVDDPLVLFAPKHPNPSGSVKLRDVDRELNRRAYVRLLGCGVRLRVRFGGDLAENGLWLEEGVEFEQARYAVSDALDSMRRADVVVGVCTFAHVAVAEGIPTVMFDQGVRPHSMTRFVLNWELYRGFRAFPLDLLDDGRGCEDVLRDALTGATCIDDWRSAFIGERFEQARFVRMVEDAVQ